MYFPTYYNTFQRGCQPPDQFGIRNAEFVIVIVPCCPLLGGIVPPFWSNGADIVSAACADELKKL